MRLLIALALLAAAPASASDIRSETVTFAPGATETVITDAITGRESVAYRVMAEGGQRMAVSLSPSNLATYFNVYAPGNGPGDEALAVSGQTGERVPDLNRFDAELPLSGSYTITVYMMRSAARRGERSDYTLTVEVTGDLRDVVKGDYADGLQGGPDRWQVRTRGGALNLRALPSAAAPVAGALANGEVVTNRGCRIAESRRWCRVTRATGAEGWAAGDFLREAP
ncbi:SH3 domain-containing protein [Rhodovulum sp. DZ06]|uniref:SH3 domain-containing protein n=1 Tax=Rhodovulum sp. DZ06 TaxID=3425126 RepID=UPI003D34752C